MIPVPFSLSPMFFTTEPPPPELITTSILQKGAIILCGDTLSVAYNHPLFNAHPACGPIIDLIQQISNPADTDANGIQLYSYDTLTPTLTTWLSVDSLTIHAMLPSGFMPGGAYSMVCHYDRITGTLNNIVQENFTILNNFNVSVGEMGSDTTIILPTKCSTKPNMGNYGVNAGDTIIIQAPDTVDNLVFDHWNCIGD